VKKLFKIISIIIGAILGIAIIAVTAFIFTFDANNYKKEITQEVEQLTGRKFEIAGNIEISVFPWLGVKVDKVGLGNAPGFSKKAFAKINQLDVKIKFLPLLEKKVEVDKIRLHGLSLSLETDADGNNNWADLAGGSVGDATTTTTPSTTQPAVTVKDEAAPALAGLAVNGLELVDGNILWSDAKNSINAKISSLNLETGAIRFGQPIAVKLSVQIENNQPEMQASIVFDTLLRINKDFSLIDATSLQLGVDTIMPSVLKERISFVLSTDTHVDLKQQTAQLTNTRFSIFDLVMSGAFDINKLMETPEIKGTLNIKEFNAHDLANKLQIELPPMAGEQSLKAISVSMKIDTDTKKLNLDDLIVKLDASTIKGWLHVDDIKEQKVQFSLAMDSIKLEDYMAPEIEPAQTAEKETKPVKTAKPAKEKDIEIVLPVELLRTLNLNGEFVLGETSLQGIPIKKFRVNTQIEGGVVKINPIEMSVLNTDVRAAGQVDVRKKTPVYLFTLEANNLDSSAVIDPMLKAMVGNDDLLKLVGTVSLNANIKTRGVKLNGLMKAATGKVDIDMNELGMQGLDFNYFSRQAAAKILEKNNVSFNKTSFLKGQDTKQKNLFNSFHASFKIAKGKAVNKDFSMKSDHVTLTGSGEVDFINGYLNYQPVMQLNLDNPVDVRDKIRALPIIYRVYGPFGDLKYELNKKLYFRNAGRLLKQEAKARAIKKLKQKGKSKWGNVKSDKQTQVDKKADEARKKAKEKLKDLFGR